MLVYVWVDTPKFIHMEDSMNSIYRVIKQYLQRLRQKPDLPLDVPTTIITTPYEAEAQFNPTFHQKHIRKRKLRTVYVKHHWIGVIRYSSSKNGAFLFLIYGRKVKNVMYHLKKLYRQHTQQYPNSSIKLILLGYHPIGGNV